MDIDVVGIIKRRIPGIDPSEFLKPDIKPYLRHLSAVKNMDIAVSRMIDVITNADQSLKIVVAGDYDADGICSVSAISRMLRLFGRGDHKLMLPDRLSEGHGMSEAFTSRILIDKPDFVVIVDCGSTSQASIARLTESARHGVLIMDHHQAPGMAFPQMPDGALIINPALDPWDGAPVDDWIASGISEVCAGGIVYLFAAQFVMTWRKKYSSGTIQSSEPISDDEMRSLLIDISALAAITTITDMARLTRLNRAIVKTCLPHIGRISGIRALAKKFNPPLSVDYPKASDVGFKYGPVINASGRIYHGSMALKLMLESDDAVAGDIAAQAIEVNEERKLVQQGVVKQCIEDIDEESNHGHLVRNNSFHPGVVGLAASRILERTGRPAIVIGAGGAASARSIPGFDIGAFIHKAASDGLIISGGGHGAAGGFRVDDHPNSHRMLESAFFDATRGLLREASKPDIIVPFGKTIDLKMVYEAFSPYGIGNPPLSIMFMNPVIEDETWYGKGSGEQPPHWKAKICAGNDAIPVQWFNAKNSRFFPKKTDSLRGAEYIRGRIEPAFGWKSSGYVLMAEAADFALHLTYSLDGRANKTNESSLLDSVMF